MTKCPFPGMDPYLEHPALWQGVHNSLIAAVADELNELLPSHYYAALEERLYLLEPEETDFIGRGDVSISSPGRTPRRGARALATVPEGAVAVQVPVPDEIRETYLEIHEPRQGKLVTVIELLSPTNKRPGAGRDAYLGKRRQVLQTRTHLVEIDLVRRGDPPPILGPHRQGDCAILVSRGNRRPRAELYGFGLRERIPAFRLPLAGDDAEPELDVGRTLHSLYARARFAMRLDYSRPPVPPLQARDRAWAAARLKAAGLR